jgi:hypothetical protein
VATVALAAALAGCGSSGGSGLKAPKIGAAKTFQLAAFTPAGPVRAGVPTKLSFHVQQPSGAPLTRYKTGSGPHTGVHLIIVRKDLATIIHRHPPIGPDGTIAETVVFPQPGPYRVLVDVYPDLGPNFQPNFQLFADVDVRGAYHPRPLPAFHSTVTVGGDRFTVRSHAALRSLQPALLDLNVTDAAGRPARFTPWYGALAHAIFFREGSLAYFHTHVCAPAAAGCTSVLGGAKVTGKSATPGKLTVGVLLPEPGTWRLFLQSKVEGKVVTAPFTLKAA